MHKHRYWTAATGWLMVIVLSTVGVAACSSSQAKATPTPSPSPIHEPACDQGYAGTAAMLSWFSHLNTTQQGVSKENYHASLKVLATTEPADANAVAKPCRLVVFLSQAGKGLLLKWTYHDDSLTAPSHKPDAQGRCTSWCNVRGKKDISGETELKNINYVAEQDKARPITTADRSAGITFRGQVTVSFDYRQRTDFSTAKSLASLKFVTYSFSVLGSSGMAYVDKGGVVMIEKPASAGVARSYLPLVVAVSGLPGPDISSVAFGPGSGIQFTPPIYVPVPGLDGEVKADLSR